MNIIATIILPIGLQLQLLTTIATKIVQEKFSWKKIGKKKKTIIITIIFIKVFSQYSSYVCKNEACFKTNKQTISKHTTKQHRRHHYRSQVNEFYYHCYYYYYDYYYYYYFSLTVHYIKKAKRTHRCSFVEAPPRLGPFEIDASSFLHFDSFFFS